MTTPRSHAPTNEQGADAGRYIGAIFLAGAVLWMLLTVLMAISPPSKATLCGDEAAMCCWPCAVGAWFTIVPFAGFFFALILFLPGFVITGSIARRVAWWRPAYWIPGWAVTGVVAAVLLSIVFAIMDRKFIALNIRNGILSHMAVETVGFMVVLGFFGLLCGLCYWLMRDKRSADKQSLPARPSSQ